MARPGVAVAAAAVALGSPEAVEDPRPVVVAYARALVPYRRPEPGAVPAGRDGDAGTRWGRPYRVREQVADGPAQGVVVADDREAWGEAAVQELAAFGGERGELLAGLAGRRREVDVGVGEGGGAAAGGGEQVLDQAGHAGGGPVDAAGGDTAVLLVRVLRREDGVDVGADDRRRAAQLVGGVVDELALGAESLVEAVEHGVDGVGEVAQLVLGAVRRMRWERSVTWISAAVREIARTGRRARPARIQPITGPATASAPSTMKEKLRRLPRVS
jgi:hypothetical protein